MTTGENAAPQSQELQNGWASLWGIVNDAETPELEADTLDEEIIAALTDLLDDLEDDDSDQDENT